MLKVTPAKSRSMIRSSLSYLKTSRQQVKRRTMNYKNERRQVRDIRQDLLSSKAIIF